MIVICATCYRTSRLFSFRTRLPRKLPPNRLGEPVEKAPHRRDRAELECREANGPAMSALGSIHRHVRNVMEFRPGSIRLEAGKFHDLGPFLRFLSEKPSELGRRAGSDRAAQAGQLLLEPGIGETRVDLRIEPFDNFGRRVPRRVDTVP